MSERLSPEKRALIDTLQERGALSPTALAAATGQPVQGVLCRLRSLADRKLIILDADSNARLPGQPPPPRWMPDYEREREEGRRAWLERGIVVIALAEADDCFLRERLHQWACRRYGRRRAVRAR